MLNEGLVWLLKQFQLNHLQWICIPLLVVCQQVFIVLERNVTKKCFQNHDDNCFFFSTL